jgi:DNA primase
VEGNLDVVALHQAGFDSAVASCGTAFTAEQARLLGRYTGEVVLCFDADAAGQNATRKAIDILKTAGLTVRVLTLPPKRGPDGRALLDDQGRPQKNDPDDFLRTEGARAFAALLERPETDGQYRLSRIQAQYDLTRDDQRIAFCRAAAKYAATVSSPVEREILVRVAATAAGVSEDSLLSEVARLRAAFAKARKSEARRSASAPGAARQPAERTLRYKNPVSALQEERLIAALLARPDLLPWAAEKIQPEDFSAPLLSKLYAAALARRAEGLDVSPAACMTALSPEESAHLAALLAAPAPGRDGQAEAADYIDHILLEKAKRAGDSLGAIALAEGIKRRRSGAAPRV